MMNTLKKDKRFYEKLSRRKRSRRVQKYCSYSLEMNSMSPERSPIRKESIQAKMHNSLVVDSPVLNNRRVSMQTGTSNGPSWLLNLSPTKVKQRSIRKISESIFDESVVRNKCFLVDIFNPSSMIHLL